MPRACEKCGRVHDEDESCTAPFDDDEGDGGEE